MKVFCGKCKRYLYVWYICPPWEHCYAPDNMIDTYLTEKAGFAKTPKEQNKNNDCPWFVENPPEPSKPPKKKWWQRRGK